MVKNDIIMVLMMPMNMMIIFWVNDSSLMGKLDIAVNKKAIKTNRNENPAALSFLPSRAFFAISITCNQSFSSKSKISNRNIIRIWNT